MSGAVLTSSADSTGRVPAQTSLEMGRYEAGAACTARGKVIQCLTFRYIWCASNRKGFSSPDPGTPLLAAWGLGGLHTLDAQYNELGEEGERVLREAV